MQNQMSHFNEYRERAALSNEQLMRACPAVFAERAHERTSERYAFIPTIQLVDGLRGAGWHPVSAKQANVRDVTRRGFQKHVVRFQHADAQKMVVLGDTTPELVLVNSHDSGSAYQLHAGLFRLACLNGLVVADKTLAKKSVRHSGDAVQLVIEGTYQIVDELPKVMESVRHWGSIVLTGEEQIAFARAALMLRYDSPEEAPVMADQLNRVRRSADTGSDLWSTGNRVQENLTKGGLRGRVVEGRRKGMRKVGSIGEDTRLNKALWSLAAEMQALKA